jgi:hypothetical protein
MTDLRIQASITEDDDADDLIAAIPNRNRIRSRVVLGGRKEEVR